MNEFVGEQLEDFYAQVEPLSTLIFEVVKGPEKNSRKSRKVEDTFKTFIK